MGGIENAGNLADKQDILAIFSVAGLVFFFLIPTFIVLLVARARNKKKRQEQIKRAQMEEQAKRFRDEIACKQRALQLQQSMGFSQTVSYNGSTIGTSGNQQNLSNEALQQQIAQLQQQLSMLQAQLGQQPQIGNMQGNNINNNGIGGF